MHDFQSTINRKSYYYLLIFISEETFHIPFPIIKLNNELTRGVGGSCAIFLSL